MLQQFYINPEDIEMFYKLIQKFAEKHLLTVYVCVFFSLQFSLLINYNSDAKF